MATTDHDTLEVVQIALGETPQERENRLQLLFGRFDVNSAGSVDRNQLEEGFKKMEIPSHYKFAKELLEACDMNHDGKCDFGEFQKYMNEKEVELYSLFREIDISNDGVVEPSDLEKALHEAGIDLGRNELMHFVNRMDKDHNGVISFAEWRDFLLLLPGRITMATVYQYWEKECQVDIGEHSIIPEGVKRRHVDTWKYFVAGGVAGMVSRTVTAPLDRLKVMLQVGSAESVLGSAGGGKPLTIYGGFRHMYLTGGFWGLFRGNGVNIIKVAPESALKFFVYESMKKVIADGSHGEITPLGRLAAGGIAGATAQSLIYPLDLLKTRLQTYPALVPAGSVLAAPPSFARLAADIFRDGGLRGFYRGITPTLVGVVPYAGLDLAAYETLKDLARTFLTDGKDPGPLIQLTCGTISGAFGASVVYPLNVIRTRLQAQRPDSPVKYTTMTDVVVKTLGSEGVRGFYRGLTVNLLKVAPMASITYATYEEMKKVLGI